VIRALEFVWEPSLYLLQMNLYYAWRYRINEGKDRDIESMRAKIEI
jgi:hypothetical protein